MKIRKTKKEDFEGYFKLECEFSKYNNYHSVYKDFKYNLIKPQIKKNFLRKLNKKEKLFLVLENDDKELQGYMFAELDTLSKNGYKFGVDKIGYIENIIISKNFRKQGYFSKFMEEFIKYLKTKNIRYCALHVDLNNKLAVKAYKKYNFKPQEYKMISKI